jgi:CelD/BcsL family acetyltransferase involved in cellulose biosynthesis
MNGMKINVIPGRDLDDGLCRAWSDLLLTNPELTSPYFRPEFTAAVAAVRNNVEIAVIESNGEIAALLPFQRGSNGAGLPVGGVLSDYQAVICRPDFEFDARELVRGCGLAAWDFDHLLVSQKPFQEFHRDTEDSPRMDLSRGYAAYAMGRRVAGSEQIKKCANLTRRIEREIGPLRFTEQATDVSALEEVLSLKSRQFLETGKVDLFADAWIRALLKRIHAAPGEEFAGMLSTLHVGDRLVAGHFGMRSRTVWHYWFPAYDEALALYSPGLILLLKMAEHAPSLGLQIIDLGKGVSLYKQRLMSNAISLAAGSVELPSLLSFRRNANRKLRALVKNSPLAGPIRRVGRWARGTPGNSCKRSGP